MSTGIRGPLFKAVRDHRSRTLVRIAGTKSGLFPVHVALSHRFQGPEGVQFGNHKISPLLCADDVLLMSSPNQDLQHVLGPFGSWFSSQAKLLLSPSVRDFG